MRCCGRVSGARALFHSVAPGLSDQFEHAGDLMGDHGQDSREGKKDQGADQAIFQRGGTGAVLPENFYFRSHAFSLLPEIKALGWAARFQTTGGA